MGSEMCIRDRPGTSGTPRGHDTRTGAAEPLAARDGRASLYVCGITPYDATHMGHAATYVNFDLLHRVWRDAGHEVDYVQNVTDVDDPLLERANATGVDWRELAASQTELFRTDMTALNVLPPDHYVGATEAVDWSSAASDVYKRQTTSRTSRTWTTPSWSVRTPPGWTGESWPRPRPVSYTHLRAHETLS